MDISSIHLGACELMLAHWILKILLLEHYNTLIIYQKVRNLVTISWAFIQLSLIFHCFNHFMISQEMIASPHLLLIFLLNHFVLIFYVYFYTIMNLSYLFFSYDYVFYEESHYCDFILDHLFSFSVYVFA